MLAALALAAMSLETKLTETAQSIASDAETDGRKIAGFAIALAFEDGGIGAAFITGDHASLVLASVARLTHKLNAYVDGLESPTEKG